MLVVTWTVGLPADALTFDGESFATDVRRVRADRFDGIERVAAGYTGQFVGDRDGNGFIYDGHTLPRVVDPVIDAPGAPYHGLPAWSLALLSPAKVTPADLHVHGVMLPVSTEEAVAFGLEEDVRHVLLARGRTKDDIRVARFSRRDLDRFGPESVIGFDRNR